MFHMIAKAAKQGNPKYIANWTDESLNRVLKACCRTQSQATFEESVLLSIPTLLAPSGGH